jgi:hypothetical protein
VKARAGSKGSAQAFAELGIHTRELRTLNPAQLLDRVADGARGAGDRTKALAALSSLLGARVAQRLAPALLSGAKGMGELRKEAHELGLVMSDQQLRVTAEAAQQWRLLNGRGRGLANELAADLAPLVIDVLRGILGWVRANRELLSQRVEAFVRQLTRALEGLNTAVQAIGGWGVVLINVATGAGMIYLLLNLDRVLKLLRSIRVATELAGIAAEPVLEGIGAALAAAGIEVAPLLAALAALAAVIVLAGLGLDDFITFLRGGKSVLGDGLDTDPALRARVRRGPRPVPGDRRLGGSAWRSVVILTRAIATGLAPALSCSTSCCSQ